MLGELRCHVRVRGQGFPLVLVHGVAGSGLIWTPVAERLEHRFELIAVDLLGYGNSPKPRTDYTAERHVEAIRRSVEDQLDGRAYGLVGLSMGAVLTGEYARRWPEGVEGIVDVGFPYYRSVAEARTGLSHNPWTSVTLHAPAVARVLIGGLWGAGRRSAVLSRLLAPRIYAGEVARESMMAEYHSFASTMHRCLVELRPDAALDETAAIPTTLLHGTDDRWCPADRLEAMAARRPNCSFHALEGGHNLVVLRPEVVAERIAAAFG
jgi:pimeloyl-ACP methyl ester carboxylesterase